MPGRQSTAPLSLLSKKPERKNSKRKKQRSLNALAIAEKTNPERTKIRRHRLGQNESGVNEKRKRDTARNGESDDFDRQDDLQRDVNPKRKKTRHDKPREDLIDYGSDSEGNEWMLGGVGSDDDESLDSDEAMGDSDEEKFEGFVFRGSSSAEGKRQNRMVREDEATSEKIDLSEGEGNGEVDDDLGDEGVDMVAVLDAGSEIEEEEESHSEYGSSGRNEEAASYISEGDEPGNLVSDDEHNDQHSEKLAGLQSLITSMNEQDSSQAPKRRMPGAHESNVPSEYGISSKQKLTIADLFPSVTDPQLKKSLRVLAENGTKPSIKRDGIAKKLDVPLPKRQQDRLDRKAAYGKSKETLDRWVDTVKHNRQAEHLSFPLQGLDTLNARGTSKLDRHTNPLTDLESTIWNILQDSGLAPENGQTEEDQIQAFEDSDGNKMPLAEVQKRRAELRRSRDLLFREEIKAKRINKIKSKSYRRVHRKERERLVQNDKDTQVAAEMEDSEGERQNNDRRRAEERMGAKHRESRWAKGIKDSGRMAWDEEARGGVEEMVRREDNLKRRILGREIDGRADEESSDDDDDEDDEVDEHENGIERITESLQERLRRLDENRDIPKTGVRSSTLVLSSMKFMLDAEAARKTSNDGAVQQMERELAGEETPSEEEPEEGVGRKLYGPNRSVPQATKPKLQEQQSEFEERLDPDGEAAEFAPPAEKELQIIVDSASSRKSTSMNESLPSRKQSRETKWSLIQPSEAIEDNPWLSGGKPKPHGRDRIARDNGAALIISNESPDTASGAVARKRHTKSRQKAAGMVELVQTRPKDSAPQQASAKGDASDGDDEDAEVGNSEPFMLRNQELVRKAFAGEDVVADFQKEKEERMQSEDEKVVDDTLAGWGHWIGAGIGKKAQRGKKKGDLSKQEGRPRAQRQDAKLDKVVINEKRVKKNAKYLASQLPHPFETRQQYERSLRLPVGPEWTTKETFQAATKPRVLMKQGIIRPMAKPMV
ncbi:MAG: hypothetical protein Q9172_001506 [Xanthocarpia lactea]